MAKLNQKMKYPVPDTYLSQSMAAGNEAELDYLGPDTIWVDVYKEDSEDGKEVKGRWTHFPIKTNYLDDGDLEDYENEDQTAAIEALPVPLDSARIKIDCTKDAHICAIWANPSCTGDERGSYDKLPQTQDKLADGTVYYERPRNDSIPPDHVWDRDVSAYNFDTKEWDLVLHKTWAPTMDTIREGRNQMLSNSDVKELLPEGDEKAAWTQYRQELRDLPQTYEGKTPHTVPIPVSPEEQFRSQIRHPDAGNPEDDTEPHVYDSHLHEKD